MKWWLYVSFRWFIPRSFPRSQPRVNIYIKSGLINHYPTHFPFSIYRTLEQQKNDTHMTNRRLYTLCFIVLSRVFQSTTRMNGCWVCLLFCLFYTRRMKYTMTLSAWDCLMNSKKGGVVFMVVFVVGLFVVLFLWLFVVLFLWLFFCKSIIVGSCPGKGSCVSLPHRAHWCIFHKQPLQNSWQYT